MKYLSALLVVLAVFTLGTTTLATTATAGEIYAPRSWDTGDGGIVSYGDPDGGGGTVYDRSGSTATTYRNSTTGRTDFVGFSRRWAVLISYLIQERIRRGFSW